MLTHPRSASTVVPALSEHSRTRRRRRGAMGSALVVMIALAGSVLTAAPADAASSQPLAGIFQTHFPQGGQGNNIPSCPDNTFCATGTLHGFGPAVLDIFDTNFQPVPGTNCLSFDKQDNVVLADGSTLVLTGSGELCFPGTSGNVPPTPNNRDYGHPSSWLSVLTVDGRASTGLFEGALGSVTEVAQVAGVGVFSLNGSLS
jgi:hypothetical protein